MIKVSNVSTMNFDGAMRGMRNPMNSHDKSDSYFLKNKFYLGKNDLDLAMRLVNAGESHRKFLRQIMVCLDIKAPLYWWKEFDTYKVGTTANSQSTMHKLMAEPFDISQFSTDNMNPQILPYFKATVEVLEYTRKKFIETKDKSFWYSTIQLLPESYNQTRTVTLNYEVLANMYDQRRAHKLNEWRTFCEFIKTMPYSQLITGEKQQVKEEINEKA